MGLACREGVGLKAIAIHLMHYFERTMQIAKPASGAAVKADQNMLCRFFSTTSRSACRLHLLRSRPHYTYFAHGRDMHVAQRLDTCKAGARGIGTLSYVRRATIDSCRVSRHSDPCASWAALVARLAQPCEQHCMPPGWPVRLTYCARLDDGGEERWCERGQLWK